MSVAPHAGEVGDDWDIDKSDAPPPTRSHAAEKPLVFEGANLLHFESDKYNRPVLTIMPNPEKPVPVFYSISTKDSLVTIELFTKRPRRMKSLFDPPEGDSFRIRVVYRDNPADTAVFRVIREEKDKPWHITTEREAPFIKLMSVVSSESNPQDNETQ